MVTKRKATATKKKKWRGLTKAEVKEVRAFIRFMKSKPTNQGK